jgi:hypothetical protein
VFTGEKFHERTSGLYHFLSVKTWARFWFKFQDIRISSRKIFKTVVSNFRHTESLLGKDVPSKNSEGIFGLKFPPEISQLPCI